MCSRRRVGAQAPTRSRSRMRARIGGHSTTGGPGDTRTIFGAMPRPKDVVYLCWRREGHLARLSHQLDDRWCAAVPFWRGARWQNTFNAMLWRASHPERRRLNRGHCQLRRRRWDDRIQKHVEIVCGRMSNETAILGTRWQSAWSPALCDKRQITSDSNSGSEMQAAIDEDRAGRARQNHRGVGRLRGECGRRSHIIGVARPRGKGERAGSGRVRPIWGICLSKSGQI